MNNRGELLVSNVVFIILNVVFLGILVVFITISGSSVHAMEEAYAKKIALVLDSATPGMEIFIDLSEAMEEDWTKEHYLDVVRIEENIVSVKLSEETSYSYAFFNDVGVSFDVHPEGKLYLVIRE